MYTFINWNFGASFFAKKERMAFATSLHQATLVAFSMGAASGALTRRQRLGISSNLGADDAWNPSHKNGDDSGMAYY